MISRRPNTGSPVCRIAAGGLADGHRAVVLDRLDAHNVAVREPGPVVVDPVDDQIVHARPGAFGQGHRPAAVDQAEAQELAADPAGQLPHVLMAARHQDHVLAVRQQRRRHLRGGLDRLLRQGADDTPLLVVEVRDLGVPGPQPQCRVALPRRVNRTGSASWR